MYYAMERLLERLTAPIIVINPATYDRSNVRERGESRLIVFSGGLAARSCCQ